MVDPDDCTHPAMDLSANIEQDQGDVRYVDAECTECGAEAAAVFVLTHYLVFEEEGGEPVEIRSGGGEREALVTFYPREMAGDHSRTRPARERSEATYLVPLADATIGGELVEGDRLKDHENAPEWVRSWDGPFRVDVSEVK